MISAWWLLAAFIGGSYFGLFVMSLANAASYAKRAEVFVVLDGVDEPMSEPSLVA
jgi:hypothetical protein